MHQYMYPLLRLGTELRTRIGTNRGHYRHFTAIICYIAWGTIPIYDGSKESSMHDKAAKPSAEHLYKRKQAKNIYFAI